MSTNVAWGMLMAAAVCEIGWAVGLKYTEGFTRLTPSVITISFMVASIALLAQAARVLPLGTAYAVWTGIGAVGTTVAGMWLFNEPRDALRVASIALVVLGIVGLKMTSGTAS